MKNLLLIFTLLPIFHSTASAEHYLFIGAHFPHVLEETPEGEFRGVGADIAKEIVEGLGHTLQIKLYPWSRAQRMLKTGKADVIIGPYKTLDRSQFMNFSEHHFYTDRIVFYRKINRHLTWNGDFSTLQNYAIGTTFGWSYGDAFDKAKETLTLKPVKNLCDNFKKLMLGRIDLVPATQRNALVCINTLNIANEVVLLSPDIESTKGYYGFSKQSHLVEFREQFNAKLKEMVHEGEVARINEQYQLQYE